MSQEFVDLVNRFGFQIQSLMVGGDKVNALCAMNIYDCLMMCAAGSQDKNLAAFGKALGFDPTELGQVVENIVRLVAHCKTNDREIELTSASSVWHDPGFILEEPWAKTMETTFGAKFGPLALQPINQFIEAETGGRLKDVVKAGELQGVVLMLVSCLFFKARWVIPFEKRMTKKSSFYPFEGEVQTCRMMHRVGTMQYMEDEKMQVCVLPYKMGASLNFDNPEASSQGGSLSSPKWKAAIILPKERGLPALTEILSNFSITPFAISALLTGPEPKRGSSFSGGVRSNKIDLSLPSFTLKLQLDLIKTLSTLGLDPVFEASFDFEPISRSGQLLINRITHDIFIEVNEEGTEVAAATVVSFSRSMTREIITPMLVDRPFIFLVFDAVSMLVLCSVAMNRI